MSVRLKPDVVLMDMRMPDYDGGYGTRKIKDTLPDVKVLVLTTFDDKETVDKAISSGADGYILKEMDNDKIINSINLRSKIPVTTFVNPNLAHYFIYRKNYGLFSISSKESNY